MIQKYKDDSLYGAILRPNDNGTLCYVADCLAEIAKKDILLQEQHKIIGNYAQRNEELNEMDHKAQDQIEALTAENKRLREGLLDAKWRLHNPYGAFLYDAAKKDNCRNCIHVLPATLPSAIDRISCKYADGWPHWSTKCNKWEKEQALRGGEVKGNE